MEINIGLVEGPGYKTLAIDCNDMQRQAIMDLGRLDNQLEVEFVDGEHGDYLVCVTAENEKAWQIFWTAFQYTLILG